jgi:hypothetical protein
MTTTTPHISQVRQALLDTLQDLRNRENPMDIERAKAVATVASVLIDTAKVENEYLKITGQDQSTFLETPPDSAIALNNTPTAHNPFPSVTSYRLQG